MQAATAALSSEMPKGFWRKAFVSLRWKSVPVSSALYPLVKRALRLGFSRRSCSISSRPLRPPGITMSVKTKSMWSRAAFHASRAACADEASITR